MLPGLLRGKGVSQKPERVLPIMALVSLGPSRRPPVLIVFDLESLPGLKCFTGCAVHYLSIY
jgi:hypothetical protein